MNVGQVLLQSLKQKLNTHSESGWNHFWEGLARKGILAASHSQDWCPPVASAKDDTQSQGAGC